MGPKVHEHMTDRPRCVTPETPVSEAAELMASEDVGSLPILDGDKLVGVVTDRDIVIRAVAAKKNPQGMPVREVATQDPVTVRADDDLSDALELMASYQVRRLPVVDEDNRLVEFLRKPTSRWEPKRGLSGRWSRKSHRRRRVRGCRSTDTWHAREGAARVAPRFWDGFGWGRPGVQDRQRTSRCSLWLEAKSPAAVSEWLRNRRDASGVSRARVGYRSCAMLRICSREYLPTMSGWSVLMCACTSSTS